MIGFAKNPEVFHIDSQNRGGFYTQELYPGTDITWVLHAKHYAGAAFEGQMILPPRPGMMKEFAGKLTTRFWDEHADRLIRSSRISESYGPNDARNIRDALLKADPGAKELLKKQFTEPQYLTFGSKTIKEWQFSAVERSIQLGALDPNKRIYIRTITFPAKLYGRDEKDNIILEPGLGVGNVNHVKALEIMSSNVGSYLGENEVPAFLIYENPDTPDGGVELPLGMHKLAHNYTVLARGKNLALRNGFHEAIVYLSGKGKPVNEGCGEGLAFIYNKRGGPVMRVVPKSQPRLPSRNLDHLVNIAKLLEIPVEEDIPTPIDDYLGMDAHIAVGTWAECVRPGLIFRYSDRKVAKPDFGNKMAMELERVFYASIRGMPSGYTAVDELTRQKITPLNFY